MLLLPWYDLSTCTAVHATAVGTSRILSPDTATPPKTASRRRDPQSRNIRTQHNARGIGSHSRHAAAGVGALRRWRRGAAAPRAPFTPPLSPEDSECGRHAMPSQPCDEHIDEPRTLTGKRPSPASLQRQHEYMDWRNNLPDLPYLERPGTRRCESYEAFMAVRRGKREDARLQRRSAKRSQERLELPSAATLARQRDYFEWLQLLPDPTRDDMERDESWEHFMRERRKQQHLQHNAARRVSTTRGRPIDPASARQQRLTRSEGSVAKPGRPINPNSERQKRLAAGRQRKSSRRGRPVDPTSKRQQQLAARAERRANPVSPRSKKRRQVERWQQQRELELQPWLKELAAKREHAARQQDAYVAHLEAIASELTRGMRALGKDAAQLLKHVGGMWDQGGTGSKYYKMLLERVANGGAVHWTDVRGSQHGCKWREDDMDGETWTDPAWAYRCGPTRTCAASLFLEHEVPFHPNLVPCPQDERGYAPNCRCRFLSPRFKQRTMFAGKYPEGSRAAPISCAPIEEWPPMLKWDVERMQMVQV